MTEETTLEETQGTAPAAAESADTAKPQTEAADETAPQAEATVDATPDQAEGDGPDDAQASEAAKTLQKRKQTAKDRIGELTRQKRDAERDAAQLRKRLERYEEQAQEPDPAKYDDLDKLSSDQAASAAAKMRKAELEADATDASERATQARQAEWAARVAAFKEEAPDFEQVAFSPNVPVTTQMAEILTDSDHGPAVAYYLGNNPLEAAEIAQLSEREQAMAIGRIEGQLSQKPVRRVTQAPEPVQTVSGKSPGAIPDLNKMSMKEYAAFRNAEANKGS